MKRPEQTPGERQCQNMTDGFIFQKSPAVCKAKQPDEHHGEADIKKNLKEIHKALHVLLVTSFFLSIAYGFDLCQRDIGNVRLVCLGS